MSKFWKYFLICAGLNLLYIGLALLPLAISSKDDSVLVALILGFVGGGILLFVQLILGIVFVAGQKKDLGKAMLLTVGIFLLVGLSVCSSMVIGV